MTTKGEGPLQPGSVGGPDEPSDTILHKPTPSDNAEIWEALDHRDVELLEAERIHLGLDYPKQCVARLLAHASWPTVGLRNVTAWGMAADLRRAGYGQEQTTARMTTWWEGLPPEVRDSRETDGQPFSLAEVVTACNSAYRPPEPRTPGCNWGPFQAHCVTKEACPFYRSLLGPAKVQPWQRGVQAFLTHWPSARGANGRQLLGHADRAVYLGIAALEKRRGYKPGHRIIASYEQIGEAAGVARQHVGKALRALVVQGLIEDLKVGRKRAHGERARASTFKRRTPVPLPPNCTEQM